jgi:hypothetical protein
MNQANNLEESTQTLEETSTLEPRTETGRRAGNPANREIKRRKRKKYAKPLTLKTLNAVLSEAITRLKEHLDDAKTAEETRRTAYALATVSGTYVKSIEAVELEGRIKDLEGAQAKAGEF